MIMCSCKWEADAIYPSISRLKDSHEIDFAYVLWSSVF